MYKLTDPEDAPNEAQYVDLEFEKGDCVAVGQSMNPAQVLKTLNALAKAVKSVDIIENRFVGMKSRGVYELQVVRF